MTICHKFMKGKLDEFFKKTRGKQNAVGTLIVGTV